MKSPHPHEVPLRELAQPFAVVVAWACLTFVTLRVAVSGLLPAWAIAILAPASALALVAAVFYALVSLGLLKVDETGAPRSLAHRHGFWVLALGLVTGLPRLGAFSLIDPWETHYAEVAREMIERRDFISPWWANEGWFTSKPVLIFWLEAASMVALGVRTGPDQVLAGVNGAAHPEWAIRLPGFVLALVGAYILYYGVSRTCGRRAGAMGGVALLTMPGYALLSHQALTDMPLIASMAASMGLLLRALNTADAAQVERWSVRLGNRTARFHAGHALALLLLLLCVPQLVILASSHVHADVSGLHFGADRLLAGSPHACTLPGQPPCARALLAHPKLAPILQIACWTSLLLWLTARVSRETRAARLFALAAWTAAALGAMSKGPVALVVPAMATLTHLASTRSIRSLWRLEIPRGLSFVVVLVAPWYLAVYARHGSTFLDELVVRNMLGRTLGHLHDTNGSDDVGVTYFIKQLGFAFFPWSGLALAATLSALAQDKGGRRSHVRAFLFGATLSGFALVTWMGTKFHHYGLIVVPSTAMLIGLWLDERLSEARRKGRARRAATAASFALAGVVTLLVARDLSISPASGHVPGGAARLIHLLTYRYDRRWPTTESFAPSLGLLGIATAASHAWLASRRHRARAAVAFGIVVFASCVIILDSVLVGAAPNGGQRGVIEAYYRAKGDDRSPLVAYQLNWKGENFYTGNHVALFKTSGAVLATYLAARKQAGDGTVYFVTERARVIALRAELGAVGSFSELTDASISEEFSLVRCNL